ncbi:MAG TPA: hypothetical protein PKY82_18935 [Pyrinomonadaceae bacterium]|nr:hypothetical protein [Pyrinomonadaceae bacterium]
MKKNNLLNFSFALFCVVLGLIVTRAQSTNVEFPTPVSSNEIKGKIKARDLGDSRLTSHYFVFDGNQGDIFISIETNNLEGDIDVFLANSLKPLTKITLFAETTPSQTGREIYLRKSERMILRVEGRTPNDDEATYSIKFAGSFQTIAANAVKQEPKVPQIKSEIEGEVKVNSVGTIIETKKEPISDSETIAKENTGKNTNGKRNTKSNTARTPQSVSTVKPKTSTTAKKETKIEPKTDNSTEKLTKPEVLIAENLPKTTDTEEISKSGNTKTETATNKPKTTTKKATTTKKGTSPKTTVTKTTAAKTKSAETEELTKALENIKLVVLFKDGATIERPLNEVLRFGVDKGVLTIVSKDGSIGRYSILDITKISVE